jgi:hypothetical protein
MWNRFVKQQAHLRIGAPWLPREPLSQPASHPGFSGELILLSVFDAGSLRARRLIDGMVEGEAAVIGQLQGGVKR